MTTREISTRGALQATHIALGLAQSRWESHKAWWENHSVEPDPTRAWERVLASSLLHQYDARGAAMRLLAETVGVDPGDDPYAAMVDWESDLERTCDDVLQALSAAADAAKEES